MGRAGRRRRKLLPARAVRARHRCMSSVWKPVTAQLQAGQLGLAAQCFLTHESQ